MILKLKNMNFINIKPIDKRYRYSGGSRSFFAPGANLDFFAPPPLTHAIG